MCFLTSRSSDPVQLVLVPLHRFDAVEGRRGHATTGCSVDQQAATAETFQLLEGGQDRHLVEVDAAVDLVRLDLDPGGSDTGALTRAVLAMHGSDLPFLDLPATTQKLDGPVTNRPNGLLARAHRLLGLPGGGNYAAAGRPVDQQGQANAPVDALERGHHAVARMRDTGVNGRGLPLDGGASCIHDLPPLHVGQRLDGAAGLLHRPPTGEARQWAGGYQPHGNSWLPPVLRTGVIPNTQRLANYGAYCGTAGPTSTPLRCRPCARIARNQIHQSVVVPAGRSFKCSCSMHARPEPWCGRLFSPCRASREAVV